jgi:predicted TPR repeat methyltransferase
MNSEHTLKQTNEFAPVYDTYISDKNWSGPEVMFNLLKPFIKKGDLLLDIGIGTGLASIPFKNAGLIILGIDGSEEMIKLCISKKITANVILSDLSKQELQLPDIEFNHIISNAVFHMVGDIGHLVKKVSDQLIPGGYFCFTTIPYEPENIDGFNELEIRGIYNKTNEVNGIIVYRHSNEYVKHILLKNDFELLSNSIFMGFNDDIDKRKVFFEIYLSRKVK